MLLLAYTINRLYDLICQSKRFIYEARIKIKKDSTFAMLLAAQKRQWDILYMELPDLFLRDDRPFARMRSLRVKDNSKGWFEFTDEQNTALDQLDIILMRKDPPFNMEYIYATRPC